MVPVVPMQTQDDVFCPPSSADNCTELPLPGDPMCNSLSPSHHVSWGGFAAMGLPPPKTDGARCPETPTDSADLASFPSSFAEVVNILTLAAIWPPVGPLPQDLRSTSECLGSDSHLLGWLLPIPGLPGIPGDKGSRQERQWEVERGYWPLPQAALTS